MPSVSFSAAAAASDAAPAPSPAGTHSAAQISHGSPSEAEERQKECLEAVEVKNVCPFREDRDFGSNGKVKRMFRVSDPGPYSTVNHVLYSVTAE